jgi:hypothetical protein
VGKSVRERYPRRTLGDPPRDVPLSVRLHILLGGFNNQFGWLFFGFGLVFVWVFGGSNALYDLAFFRGELSIADGKVSAIVETNVSINDSEVYEYQYTYDVDNASYAGKTKAFGGEYVENDSVVVEYVVKDHGRSRIKGLSTGSGGVWLAGIFPLVGLCFMAFGIRKGVRGRRLLRDGRQATGELISQESTNAEVNDQTVFKFTFGFTADDGRSYEVIAKTHVVDRFAGENIEGDEEEQVTAVREPLLYSPYNPRDAVMLDDLPGGPRIGKGGEIVGPVVAWIPCLVIPLVTVIGHGYWFLHVLEVV